MSNYDKSKYESPVPPKERKAMLRGILLIPIIMIASWGSREISTYEKKSKELIDLKTSYIEELLTPKLSKEEIEYMDYRISYLEKPENFEESPSKGIWMIFGSFALLTIFIIIDQRINKENKAELTTPVAARPTS